MSQTRHVAANLLSWKAQYRGMSVPDANRLGQFEEKNAKLKKQQTELALHRARSRTPSRTLQRTITR
jgi:hypothetical protein